MGHNNQYIVIQLEILYYICLLRTAHQCQSSGELCGNTEHASFYFLNTSKIYWFQAALLWFYILFSSSRNGLLYFFFFICKEEKSPQTKFHNILLFCSIKATDTLILLLESIWRFYKAQFLVVPKCYQRICGDCTAFTVVTQLLQSILIT